jgi:hypothetical protein
MSMNSPHVTGCAAPGADGVRGVEVRGDVEGDDPRVLVLAPGSVVIATVPGTVWLQPPTAPATSSAAAAT